MTSNWKDWYHKLIEFRKKHPGSWPIRKGIEFELAQWCSRQRYDYNKKKLSKGAIVKLNNIGFPWKSQKNSFEAWLKNYNDSVECKKKCGKWPHSKMQDPKYKYLGGWVGHQRNLFKKRKLEKKKIDLLKKRGFDFLPAGNLGKRWIKKYRESCKYYKRTGNWPPYIQPKEFGIKQGHTEHDLELGIWCFHQRYYRKKFRISEKKIALLDKENFDWKEDKVSNYDHFGWNKKYNQLVKFRKKYPNRLPQPYNKGEEVLHNFVKGQKRAYHEGFITPDRVKKLKKIGFSFSVRAYGKSSTKSEWKPTISQGENKKVEFKSSLRWDIRLKQVNKYLEYLVIRAISGLLNSQGGLLFIGVEDNGNILGIEHDYKTFGKKQNKDGFLSQLNNLVNSHIGKEFHRYFVTKFEKIDNNEVCIVIVSNSDSPAYLNYDNKEQFCVRGFASTEILGIREAHEYITNHWKKR